MKKTITEALWQSLETGNLPSTGIVLRRFPADFLPEISAALHMPGKHPAFVVRLADISLLENALRQSFRDLKISLVGAEQPPVLLIELQNPALREIFAVLCDDLAQHLKHETNPAVIARELRNRLHQWSLLFEKAAAPGLSPEEQRGLFGELVILKMLLENTADPLPVLNGWQGVSGGIQDFFYTDRAIEVKTTSGNQHQTVIISSAAQLDESGLAFLWLAHLLLEISSGGNEGKSLNDAADEVLDLLEVNAEATTRFRVKLAEVGYFEAQRLLYEQPAYQIRATRFYQVRDEFPRILPDELRSGVDAVKYSIRLSDCQTWLVETSSILQNLSILRP
jgi:uncharacterized protein YbaR (Trm112 family)